MPRLGSRWSLPRWSLVVCAVVAVALVGLGGLQFGRLDDLTTRPITVDGVPLLEVTSTNRVDAGVVVVHGFAGSARLMIGFADTLARRGYVVVLPDLTGHGANRRRLSTTDGVVSTLDGASDIEMASDIDVAVRYLRTTHALPLTRIALVGHSMGAAAVTSFAVAHTQIAATVAISLGAAEELPRDPAVPRNLLLVVGSGERDRFRAAAAEARRRGYPDASPGQTMGDPRLGTARRESVVPATEHISVLFADQTHVETARWLDAAFDRPPQPDRSASPRSSCPGRAAGARLSDRLRAAVRARGAAQPAARFRAPSWADASAAMAVRTRWCAGRLRCRGGRRAVPADQ